MPKKVKFRFAPPEATHVRRLSEATVAPRHPSGVVIRLNAVPGRDGRGEFGRMFLSSAEADQLGEILHSFTRKEDK